MLEVLPIASRILGRVLGGRNLDQALAAELQRHPGLTAQQRGLLQELSYGAVRHYSLLRAVLAALLQKPLKDESVRQLLLVALYQLAFTQTQAHAVVDHAVRVTAQSLHKASAKGLVNAVLRNFLRRREGLLAEASASGEEAKHGHPQWWIDALREQYPDAWEGVMAAGNQRPPMCLRVNARHDSPETYLEKLAQAGIPARLTSHGGVLLARPMPVDDLPGFSQGRVSVQDVGAQLAAPFLDAQPGMRVLDACAAPGGKTSHLLELADLELTALDHDASRLLKVEQNLQRLGLQARCLAGDAAKPVEWWDGAPYQRILADVPCSASGVVRRHPDIKYLRRSEDIARFAAQQARILNALWPCLAPGGKLLYVTCSVFKEENRSQIDSFLARHPDSALQPLVSDACQDMQLLPNEEHDGFYFALLAKN